MLTSIYFNEENWVNQSIWRMDDIYNTDFQKQKTLNSCTNQYHQYRTTDVCHRPNRLCSVNSETKQTTIIKLY